MIDPQSIPSNQEIEAQQLISRAQAKVNSFSLFASKESKYEEASDMLIKAGNLLKIQKKFKPAAEAFIQAGDYLMAINDQDSASNQYIEASKQLKKEYPEEAVAQLLKAVDLLKQKGRFNTAANLTKQIGEIYQDTNQQKSLEYFEQAGELFESEDQQQQANQCYLKVAEFAATNDQMDKSVQYYEKVATASMSNNLTKYSAKNYLLNAGLVSLVKDPHAAMSVWQKYCDLDHTFESTREGTFLKDLIAAWEEGDQPKFTQVIADFDRMTKLDAWKTTLLLKVKRSINEESLT